MSYLITTRRVKDGQFGHRRQATMKFLKTPGSASVPLPEHEISKNKWFLEVLTASKAALNAEQGDETQGRIVVMVHGYNTDALEAFTRQKTVETELKRVGYDGIVVGFDWPSDGNVVGYIPDRLDARWASGYLTRDVLPKFAELQSPDCRIDVSVLAHSMGCFVVREAIDWSDDEHNIASVNWSLSQIAFVAADISSKSFDRNSPKISSLIRHSARVTNYFSHEDAVLSVSNAKRIGVSNRLGRVGAPNDRKDSLVDVNCTGLFRQRAKDGKIVDGLRMSHNWYFEEPRFYEDLARTLKGRLDRRAFPTRERRGDKDFDLVDEASSV